MEFKNNEAIYLQIADYVCDHILLQKWLGEAKIPSVRELAVELQVNPNTVMRSYEFLQKLDIIYNKRGLGFFVASSGREMVMTHRRERFFEKDLPELFKTISLLEIKFSDVEQQYQDYSLTIKNLNDENK